MLRDATSCSLLKWLVLISAFLSRLSIFMWAGSMLGFLMGVTPVPSMGPAVE